MKKKDRIEWAKVVRLWQKQKFEDKKSQTIEIGSFGPWYFRLKIFWLRLLYRLRSCD